MENNLLFSSKFRLTAFVLGGLLMAFLILAILLKIHDVGDAYAHATLPGKTLTVYADGKTTALPDIAYLNFTIVGLGADLTAAKADAQKKIKDFDTALVSLGVEKGDITVLPSSSYGASSPIPPNTTPDTESMTVEVKGPKLADQVTAIFKAATDKKIDPGTGGCLFFDKPEDHLSSARQSALESATKEAHDLAQLSGLRLGKIVGISDSGATSSYNPAYGSCPTTAPTPNMEILPQELHANLSVTFEVK